MYSWCEKVTIQLPYRLRLDAMQGRFTTDIYYGESKSECVDKIGRVDRNSKTCWYVPRMVEYQVMPR